jgi:hypothetical protein
MHCRAWVTVTAASLCTCGAFVVVGPAPPAFVPLHAVKLSAADASDSESPHQAEAADRGQARVVRIGHRDHPAVLARWWHKTAISRLRPLSPPCRIDAP